MDFEMSVDMDIFVTELDALFIADEKAILDRTIDGHVIINEERAAKERPKLSRIGNRVRNRGKYHAFK